MESTSMNEPNKEKLPAGAVILDGDYYDNQLLQSANQYGILRVLFGPIRDGNLYLAFLRGANNDWWTFVDLTQEQMAGLDKDGKRIDSLVTVKIFKLTEKGKQRKRLLAMKFPAPINGTSGIVS